MDSRLEKLASLNGVEPGYRDVFGKWQSASEDACRAVLAALGIDARDPDAVEAALAERERERCEPVVPPVTVLRAKRLAEGVRIRLPEASLARVLAWRIEQEGGDCREERFDPLALAALESLRGDDVPVRTFMLPLPGDLPEGYHRVAIVEGGAAIGEGSLVVAPDRCHLPPAIAGGERVWGPAVQLYGVRSKRNAGIGDFTDLRHCAEIWGERGAAIVGTNPLHALSLRDPGHASPYSPSSRLFLNPMYLDVEAIEDFAELSGGVAFSSRWNEECARLRATEEVDYGGIAAAKRAMFETLYAHFRAEHVEAGTVRALAFARFRASRGQALRRHALHEALREFHAAAWREWPEEHRDPASDAVRRFAGKHADLVGLHEYLQWQADEQLGHVQARCREVGMTTGLYADLAISIAADGSEAWANQELYALGVSVGAPPDDFNLAGQDWGLPPLSPERLRECAYAPLIATLRANMAHAGALRIDHVMGLERLWWVPSGMTPAQGAYVRYPVDELLGIVALESSRHRCLVIGEDLGTVSESLRRKLGEAEILSYRLLLFERDGRAFRPPASYPRRALVAWSTHDLPTFAGWWQEEDLRTRRALGLLDDEGLRGQHEERRDARSALLEALAREALIAPGAASPEDPVTEALLLAVQSFLAKTPSAVMAVQMEDVLGIAAQANIPGTVDEHPNWRRKLALPLEDWARDARVRRLAKRLGSLRGRARAGDRALISRP